MSEKDWSLMVVKAKRETYEIELLYGDGAKMENGAMWEERFSAATMASIEVAMAAWY